jgi:hypothetical protein
LLLLLLLQGCWCCCKNAASCASCASYAHHQGQCLASRQQERAQRSSVPNVPFSAVRNLALGHGLLGHPSLRPRLVAPDTDI